MKRSHHISTLTGLLALAGMLALLVLVEPPSAAAQGFSIGPNGLSVGGVYIPFENGRGYYNDGRYNSYRRYPDDRGRYYSDRDYVDRWYGQRRYGPANLYWSPGSYWRPNDYWYGDRSWSRYDGNYSGSLRSNDPLINGSRTGVLGDVLSELGSRVNLRTERPPVPGLEELERMDWVHLRRVLSYGATQLQLELARQKTGNQWMNYLKVESLQRTVDNEVNAGPTSAEADELVVMLERYNQTSEDSRYTAISGLWGFETVHRALAEFLVNPASRYRRQLVMNSEQLDQSLERFKTGAGWQHHLMLPAELFLDPVEADKNPPNPDAMRKALQRYDEVAKNPDYRVVNELPAFKATHESLARYLGRSEPDEKAVTVRDHAPVPPTDPSLNEPTPIDPPVEANNAKNSVSPTKQKSILKQPQTQVEELVPPSADRPGADVPAVREKE